MATLKHAAARVIRTNTGVEVLCLYSQIVIRMLAQKPFSVLWYAGLEPRGMRGKGAERKGCVKNDGKPWCLMFIKGSGKRKWKLRYWAKKGGGMKIVLVIITLSWATLLLGWVMRRHMNINSYKKLFTQRNWARHIYVPIMLQVNWERMGLNGQYTRGELWLN